MGNENIQNPFRYCVHSCASDVIDEAGVIMMMVMIMEAEKFNPLHATR